MSGTNNPVPVQTSFFFDNTIQLAAALDVQNAIAQAGALLQQLLTLQAQISAAASSTFAAMASALPTSPAGLATGQWWLNGGIPTQVQ